MKASQITSMINEIYDGVERSTVGKIIEDVEISEKFPEGKKINSLSYNVFMSLVNSLSPKTVDCNANMNIEENR